MEAHIPVLFLDLNGQYGLLLYVTGVSRAPLKANCPSAPPADNLTVNEQLTGPHAAGVNSILPKEHGSQFFYLPIIRHSDEEVSAALHCPLLAALGTVGNNTHMNVVNKAH